MFHAEPGTDIYLEFGHLSKVNKGGRESAMEIDLMSTAQDSIIKPVWQSASAQ